ncbi:MAG: TipAS antibiotic-recognition domain-containing protein [Anaerolineae bacterium]|nr:TipAS antibiotic-recognition domain-containing protein [Anaerolineae bacterium]
MGKKDKKLFKPFSEKKQQYYERLARLEYGPDKVNESAQRWAGYSEKQRDAIMQEGSRIYTDIAHAIEAQQPSDSAAVQAMLARWHQHLRYFYEPTLEILRGLGEMYPVNPEFAATFARIHPALAEYLRDGIRVYVDGLESAELARMIDEDARKQG